MDWKLDLVLHTRRSRRFPGLIPAFVITVVVTLLLYRFFPAAAPGNVGVLALFALAFLAVKAWRYARPGREQSPATGTDKPEPSLNRPRSQETPAPRRRDST